jgi:hypothetical protein
LSCPIFERVPHSRLATILVGSLDRGLQIVNAMTERLLVSRVTILELFCLI